MLKLYLTWNTKVESIKAVIKEMEKEAKKFADNVLKNINEKIK